MNATDLQKLKELAQAATPGPWERGGKSGGCELHVYGDEFAGAAICGMKSELNFTPHERRVQNLDFIAAANPAAVLELIEIAERAVSPAESVQSVDTPEFQALIFNLSTQARYERDDAAEYRTLIAHIDAKLALAREEGCAELRRHDHEQACRVTHALMAERDDMRQRAKTAHAEGRRSAMEELHPQWLKEKERADRAEAKIACTLGIGTGEGNLFVHGSYESVKAAQEWILRAETAEAALAARQAPDLKQIMVIVEKEFDWTDFMPGHKKAIATIKSRLRTLLSSTAQPLQPLNKVVQGEDGPTAFFTVNADFPYLQQEGGKETLANGWPNDFHEVVKGAEGNAYQLGRAAGIEEVAKVFEENDMHATAADVRALAPQQSDNLQQASTAQAEPVKRKEPPFVPAGYENETEFLRQQLKDARTSIKAHQTVLRELNEAKCVPHELGYPTPETDAGNAYTNGWNDCRLTMLGELVDDPTNHPVTPAQVTPEGAELPPRLYLPGCLADRLYEAISMARDSAENDGSNGRIRKWDATAADLRAALAATTAAEPVAWVLFTEEGNSRIWFGSYDRAKLWASDNDVDPAELVPLYRAAPPQQVAPMTPEMLRAVQLRSEVGTYITANWANAYDCLQELWRVACEAQGKQVDTGGLPG